MEPTVDVTGAESAEIGRERREALGHESNLASPSTTLAAVACTGRLTRRRIQLSGGSLALTSSGQPRSASDTLTAAATTSTAVLCAPIAATAVPKGPKNASGGTQAKDE